MSVFTQFFGTHNERMLKKQIFPLVARINELEATVSGLSDTELAAKTPQFKQRLAAGASLDELVAEVYAVCREAARRVLGQRHYDVQLAGGLVLNQGKIAEMKTGEGKTLTATLPCYLRGLTGKGAHVVTVNDYLARRDAQWMGQVYRFLGLEVGVVHHGMSHTEKKAAYSADITYGTNNEFGFDYLRDNMKHDAQELVLAEFHFAIVDEVDSILIDEARTPLIISGESTDNREFYQLAQRAIVGLKKDVDYIINEKSHAVTLTDDGITYLEKRLKVADLYHGEHVQWLHYLQQALKAYVLYKKDVNYVIKDRRIVIIDEHTGRLMPGRRYGDGLHASLEAKENVPIQKETQTLANITFQNLFRMYPTLAGMTGTADTEAVEFKKIYNLDVVVVPTNKPIIRQDVDDVIFRTATEKFEAIAQRIEDAQQQGQPVLVGTTSVEKSELLSALLQKRKIQHEILNAKNHSREAEIIAKAGHVGHVTLATNMAGRGTDIQLGPGSYDKGGLLVIGSERHESRRIDNQLRGRSGRQGDPGMSCFYLSLEDDLMRIFAADRISGIMKTMGLDQGQAIESAMISRAIEKAQKRVEEQNFASRKHLLEYDDVMNTQRMIIYRLRQQALMGQLDLEDVTADVFEDTIHRLVEESYAAVAADGSAAAGDDTGELIESPEAHLAGTRNDHDLRRRITENFGVELSVWQADELSAVDDETLIHRLIDELQNLQTEKLDYIAQHEPLKVLVQMFYLYTLDGLWKKHLAAMDNLKDSVSLRGYGQRDPLQEYKKEAFGLFHELMNSLNLQVIRYILGGLPSMADVAEVAAHAQVAGAEGAEEVQGANGTEGTARTSGATTASHHALQVGGLSGVEMENEGYEESGELEGSGQNVDNGDGKVAELSANSSTHTKELVALQQLRMKLKQGHGAVRENRARSTPEAVAAPPPMTRTVTKVGRNDPCICGSGKKYKKCCGR